jgi:hypothetical protein
LQTLRTSSKEALSSSHTDFARLLAELDKVINLDHPGPPHHAEAESLYQPSDGAVSKRRRIDDETEASQSHHYEGIAEQTLVPFRHRILSTEVGALNEHNPKQPQSMDYRGTPLSSLRSNVEDFTIFKVPDSESTFSMETNTDLTAMHFGHPTNIENYALSFVPEQLNNLPDHNIPYTAPGPLPGSLEPGDNQQIDTGLLRHHDTAVPCHSSSASAQQAQLPSLTRGNLRQGIAPNTDYDQVGVIIDGQWHFFFC